MRVRQISRAILGHLGTFSAFQFSDRRRSLLKLETCGVGCAKVRAEVKKEKTRDV
jgi:hypothetical protein